MNRQAPGFSRPLHGLVGLTVTLIPAVNCWATIIRPLRGLVSLNEEHVSLRHLGVLCVSAVNLKICIALPLRFTIYHLRFNNYG